jgi:hypothetical protein
LDTPKDLNNSMLRAEMWLHFTSGNASAVRNSSK